MRKISLIIILLFVLSTFAIAETPPASPTPSPAAATPQPLGAQGPPALSYNDFQQDPTPANFNNLNHEDQQHHLFSNVLNEKSLSGDVKLREMALKYMSKKEFDLKKDKDLAIAENFFGSLTPDKNANNINQDEKTKQLFSDVLKLKGLDVKVNGEVSHYDHNSGVLKTASQEVNLNDFARQKSEYGFVIGKDNQLAVVDKSGTSHSFEGKLEPDGQDHLLIKDGSLHGHPIKDARVVLDKDLIRGKVSSFHSVEFDKKTNINYRISSDTISVGRKALIMSIGDAKIIGEGVIFPDGIIQKGLLTFKDGNAVEVGKNSRAEVQGMIHSTKEKTLQLIRANNKALEKIATDEAKALASNRKKFSKKGADPDKNPLFRREQERIRRKYQGKRNKEYDKLIPKIKPDQSKEPKVNYFIYGKNRLWLGGSGFSSEVSRNNPFFPEFNKVALHKRKDPFGESYKRRDRLIFTADGMELDLERVSDDGRALAFYTKMSGKGKIGNGIHDFVVDGKKVFDRVIGTKSGHFFSGVDMRFEYASEEGKKLYDFDVDTKYDAVLSDEDRVKLQKDKAQWKKRMDYFRARAKFMQDKHAVEFKKISDQVVAEQRKHDHYENKLRELRDKEYDLKRKIIGTSGEEREAIQRQLISIQTTRNYFAGTAPSRTKLNELKNHPLYKQITSLIEEANVVQDKMDNIDRKLTSGDAGERTGAFGQLVLSDDGTSKVSYQEYIQGFPVRKNAEALQWYKYEDKKNIKLKTPRVFFVNRDVLDLDVLNLQECIDTQFRLAYEYAKATGRDICFYYNGRQCLRDPKYKGNSRAFLHKWMLNKGTTQRDKHGNIVYNSKVGTSGYSNAVRDGHWKDDIQVVPPSDYGNVQPGDVLLLNGHAKGIKEIIEIPPGSGVKYARTFAGSQPAIDGRQYERLMRLDKIKEEGVKSVYRWKFRGKPKTSKDVHKLSTGGGIVK